MKLRKKNQKLDLSRKRTGSTTNGRAKTFSYHSVRSNNETNTGRSNINVQAKASSKPKTRWWHHIPSYLAIIVVVGSIMYTLTLSTNPKVTIVNVSNQTIVQPASVYKQAAQTIFNNSIANRTKITINTDKLAREIEHNYPEINAVSIVIPLLGHQPIVEVRPAQSIIILSNPQGQFVINQQGNAVLKLTDSIVNKYNLPAVSDNTGFKVQLGKEALPATSVKFIKTVVDQFAAKKVPIESMTLSTNPYELDVKVRGAPYFIKFNLLSDPLYSTGTYFATMKLNPTPLTQYIDVRIPGRAYYK